MVIRGGCLCGAVRYELAGAIGDTSHCYCSMCRKQHGAAFATYGTVRRRELTVQDSGAALRHYQSSSKARRSFCSVCGSSLFFEATDAPEHVEIAFGTLDDEPGVRPLAHIYVQDKPAWYRITDGLPQYRAAREPPA